MLVTDKGSFTANGEPISSNRLLLGFMTPENTVGIFLPDSRKD